MIKRYWEKVRESMKVFNSAFSYSWHSEVHIWKYRKSEDANQRKFRKLSTKNIKTKYTYGQWPHYIKMELWPTTCSDQLRKPTYYL